MKNVFLMNFARFASSHIELKGLPFCLLFYLSVFPDDFVFKAVYFTPALN